MAKVSEVFVGAEFGRLKVKAVRRVPYSEVNRSKQYGTTLLVDCECKCGGCLTVHYERLGKLTNSCGCLHRDKITTHGVSAEDKRLYYIWHGMVGRCHRPDRKAYKNYGAKGVRVCLEWMSVTTFRAWAMANGYADNLTIDRIDPAGNYEPGNCRWIPMPEQSGNRRNRAVYTAWGETKSLSEWLKDDRCTIKHRRAIAHRIEVQGWSPDRAMATAPLTDRASYCAKGEGCRQAILTRAKVISIRADLAAGHTLAAVGAKHGVHPGTIHAIKSGRTWKHV